MRRLIRLMIIAASAVVLGAMLIGISIGVVLAKGNLFSAKGNNNTNSVSDQYTKMESAFPVNEVEEISLNIMAKDVEFVKCEGDEIKISYYAGENKPDYDVSCEDGILTINQVVQNKIVFNFPKPTEFIQLAKEGVYLLYVEIPEGYEGSCQIEQTTGLVKMEDLAFKAPVDIRTTAGEVILSNVTNMEDITIVVSTGEVKLTDVSCETALSVQSTAGEIIMKNIEAGNLIASATSGNIAGTSVKAATIDTEAHSGNVRLKEVDVAEEIKTSTTAGNIHVELLDSAENYTIKSRTTSGSNNLSDKEFYGDGSGSKKITASATAGNIHYEFAEDNYEKKDAGNHDLLTFTEEKAS